RRQRDRTYTRLTRSFAPFGAGLVRHAILRGPGLPEGQQVGGPHVMPPFNGTAHVQAGRAVMTSWPRGRRLLSAFRTAGATLPSTGTKVKRACILECASFHVSKMRAHGPSTPSLTTTPSEILAISTLSLVTLNGT